VAVVARHQHVFVAFAPVGGGGRGGLLRVHVLHHAHHALVLPRGGAFELDFFAAHAEACHAHPQTCGNGNHNHNNRRGAESDTVCSKPRRRGDGSKQQCGTTKGRARRVTGAGVAEALVAGHAVVAHAHAHAAGPVHARTLPRHLARLSMFG